MESRSCEHADGGACERGDIIPGQGDGQKAEERRGFVYAYGIGPIDPHRHSPPNPINPDLIPHMHLYLSHNIIAESFANPTTAAAVPLLY